MTPEYWQLLNPAIDLSKVRSTLTIPVFDIICGEQNNGSLLFSNNTSDPNNNKYVVATSFPEFLYVATSNFTVDLWVKPIGFAPSGTRMTLIQRYRNSNGDKTFMMWIDPDFHVNVSFLNSLGTSTFKTTLTVEQFSWNHVGLVWRNEPSLNFSIWINGVETIFTHTANSVDLSAVIPASLVVGAGGLESWTEGTFQMDELRFWDAEQPKDYFYSFRNSRRTPDHVNYATDVHLVGYWKLGELGPSDLTTPSRINGAHTFILAGGGHNPTYVAENYPYTIGLSSVVARMPLSTILSRFSFKYPVIKPLDASQYSLAVSWVDNSNTLQRRWFWQNADLYRPGDELAIYRGEPINYATGFVEVWNDLYAVTVAQPTSYTLDLSFISSPVSLADTTQPPVLDSNPEMTDKLFAPFPLVFPIVFNQPFTQ